MGDILYGCVLSRAFLNYLGRRVDRQFADNTMLFRNIKKRGKCEKPQSF